MKTCLMRATLTPVGTSMEELHIPPIVCLCGSTSFWRTFQEASLRETLAGRIVLSIGAARCADGDDRSFGGYVPTDKFDRVKEALDELHLRKIDLADEVLILNVEGYVGESTRRELCYAIAKGKTVRWWEENKAIAPGSDEIHEAEEKERRL